MATNMKRCFDTLLAQVGNAPILVDIGASGKLPPGWDAIKEHSVYVGFDPDSREMREVAGTAFKRKIIVNKAVHPDTNARKISFNLTKSPFCSSVLGVDYKETRNWYFQDLFTLVSVAEVPCTTLEAALRSADVDHCDWLKIDAQGIDMRIFWAISPRHRERIMALDLEPGLGPSAYLEGNGERFADNDAPLRKEGFWLSRLNVQGSIRVGRSTLAWAGINPDPAEDRLIQKRVRPSPFWCEVRYLRTIEYLAANAVSQERCFLLGLFALIDEQPGFALEVARYIEATYGSSKALECLKSNAKSCFRVGAMAKAFVRAKLLLKPFVRKVWKA
jgi:hypothetical protein